MQYIYNKDYIIYILPSFLVTNFLWMQAESANREFFEFLLNLPKSEVKKELDRKLNKKFVIEIWVYECTCIYNFIF